MMLLALAVASIPVLAIACSSPGRTPGPAPRPVVPAAPRASAIADQPRYRLSDEILFRGACDASGAADLRDGLVAVADDEDNRLRVYHPLHGGHPVETIDVIRQASGSRADDDEMDLEGAATIAARVYWIASHGRKKSGKRAPSRLILFATDIVEGDPGKLALVGRPYPHLLDALVRAPTLARYDLAAAADRSPISPGGLNIEGLTETADGHLLLGFRNPVPGGRALLVRITNPAEMIERGEAPRFGAPIELNLDGRGIRTIASWQGAYWIVGGDIADPILPSRLYRWVGESAPVWIDSVDLRDLNIEAITEVTAEAGSRLLLLSDDGSRDMGGRRCKKLRNPAAKQFRGVWLEQTPVELSAKDRAPWINVSWFDARDACVAAGKRLCQDAEWLTACCGPRDQACPYGDPHVASRSTSPTGATASTTSASAAAATPTEPPGRAGSRRLRPGLLHPIPSGAMIEPARAAEGASIL